VKQLTFTAFSALLLAAPAFAQPQSPGGYTAWKRNDAQKRYESEFIYKNKSGGTSKQLVAVYPKDNPRSGWAYYYAAEGKGKAWGRCAIKGNPKYDAKAMYWQKLTADAGGYEDFKDQPKGFCPTPKDGTAAIPVFPDPPV